MGVSNDREKGLRGRIWFFGEMEGLVVLFAC